MKFTVPVRCSSCECDFAALGYGELTFPPATCPSCGQPIHILDPLSYSIVAIRLLYRAGAELNSGDSTMSIICAAMAIESALTSLFLKWRKMAHGSPITDADQELWEKEYRDGTRPGGFANSANFVSNYLHGKNFDDFAAAWLEQNKNNPVAIVRASLPRYESEIKIDYIHRELFKKRNRIMHWGEVSYENKDAELAHKAACSAFALLTLMDQEKAAELERKIRTPSV